jgi:putative phosphoesterase
MDLLVVADTHLRADRRRDLPEAVWQAAAEVDVILHAGDVLTGSLLDDLAALAPLHAVLGNNDHGLERRLPETVQLDLDGLAVAMIHDSGPTKGRPGRMRRRFPEADVVIFGHSHQPLDEPGDDGQRLFNPGSCTERRRAPHRTYGRLTIESGSLLRHDVLIIS